MKSDLRRLAARRLCHALREQLLKNTSDSTVLPASYIIAEKMRDVILSRSGAKEKNLT